MAGTCFVPLFQYTLLALLFVKCTTSFSATSYPARKTVADYGISSTALFGDRRTFVSSMGAAAAAGIASSASFPLLAAQPVNALGGGINKINDRLTE
jgi:hypothetical protein